MSQPCQSDSICRSWTVSICLSARRREGVPYESASAKTRRLVTPCLTKRGSNLFENRSLTKNRTDAALSMAGYG